MRSKTPPAGKFPRPWLPVVLLVAAAGLSLVAGLQVRAFWLRLPGVYVHRTAPAAMRQVLEQAQRSMPPAAREGLAAARISELFTKAWRDPVELTDSRSEARQWVGTLRQTQLGRVQLAAFALLEAERAGTPAEDRWPAIEPLLKGLDQATLAHSLDAAITHYTAALRAPPLAYDPATARAYADLLVRQPHGPLLQYLMAALDEVAAARVDADDGSVEACHAVQRRLLREWVLETGPAGLRLLAADRLAARLGPDEADLAELLQTWRRAYREVAEVRPVPLPLLSLRQEPDSDPAGHARLAGAVYWLAWLAGAACGVAAVTVIGMALGLTGVLRRSPGRRYIVAAPLTVVAVAVIGLLLAVLAPTWCHEDLRRLGDSQAGAARLPIFAIVTAVATVVAAGVGLAAGGDHTPRYARTALLGLMSWLLLAGVLLAGVGLAAGALKAYTATENGGTYAALAGSGAEQLLAELRTWHP
jgi:hypothetical protein